MNFIKKIFDNQIDLFVRVQFQKFSKGEFNDRAVINAKNNKGVYAINTSYEFSNELLFYICKKAASELIKLDGCIVSTLNLKEDKNFNNLLLNSEIKQFQGIKRYIINTSIKGEELAEIILKNPKIFFGLSLDYKDYKLKVLPKAPKSGKPSSKGEDQIRADFCKLKTSDADLARSFVFEKENWVNANITHQYIIKELILPKDEKDYAKLREMAIRKGKIIRKAEIDGKKIISEKDFEI